MKSYAEHLDTFWRFIWTLASELRDSKDIVSAHWIAGMAMLAKCMAESPGSGQDRIQVALNEFLASAPAKLMKTFDDLLKAMSQDDVELGEAIMVLSEQLVGQLAASDLGIVRNALAHAQLPSLADTEVRLALGDAFLARIEIRGNGEEGQFLVPHIIGELIAKLAQPGPKEIVQVQYSGLGSLIVETYRQNPSWFSTDGPLRLTGVESNQEIWARGVLVLRLFGVPAGSTKTSTTARGNTESPNVVISCPPVGVADKEAIQAMRFTIPKIAGDMPDQALRDFAGVFQIVHSLGSEQRAVVVVNPGLLFRVGAVARLRSGWVDEDLLEAVISLPPGLMPNTYMPTNVVIFNMNKPANRRGMVLFIAADEMGKTKGSKKLDVIAFHEEMDKIVSAYQGFQDVPGLAKVIDGFELADQEWNLIPGRFVVRDEDLEPGPDLKALQASLVVSEELAAQARTRLDETINKLLTSL